MDINQSPWQQGIHQSVCHTFQGTKSDVYQRSNIAAANVRVLRTRECGVPQTSTQGSTVDTHSQISTSECVSMDSHSSFQLEIDFNQMASHLEQRIVSSIKAIVCQAIDSLKEQVEAKMHSLRREVEDLNIWVRELKNTQCSCSRRSFSPSGQSSPKPGTTSHCAASVQHGNNMNQSDAEKKICLLQSQVHS